MRGGKLQDAQAFTFRDQEFPDEELLSSFLSLFYEQNPAPDEVLVPLEPAEAEALAEVLSERRGKRVRLLTPQRGAKADLLEVARRNAEQGFRSWHEKDERREQALVSLTRALHLARPPRWMECYDISTFQGALAVGSGVSMKDGEPDKANYRRYKVKGIPERRGSAAPRAEAKPEQPMPQDDFAMLYEVVTRRLRRALAEGQLPDLLVVDGGKGQLNAALAAAKDLGVPVKPLPGNEGAPFVELVGLAKSRVLDGPALGTTRVVSRRAARDRAVERDLVSAAEAQEKGFVPEIQRSAERVFLPGRKDPVILRQNSAELFLLARLRDEAHRFAITFHRKLRRERNFQSVLEEIPGIGEGRKKALLRHFGSLRRVKEATLEELAQVEGFGEKQAAAVRAFFHRPAPGGGEEPEVEVEPEGAPGGEGGVDPGPPAVVTEDEIDAALAAETTSGPEPTEA
jgi:excinuclease ABC subunit C